tara:strand:- start:1968 stop:2369 length:402 start_codon:yes stop_codon:yes gene_type:complete
MYGYQSVSVNSGDTSGGSGSSTSNKTSGHVVVGEICSIGVTYNGSPPASTDVVIATAGNNGPALTLLTLTNANSDGWFHLRHKVDDESGADITYDGSNEVYEKVCIADNIKVTISQANDDDSVDVVVVYYAGA